MSSSESENKNQPKDEKLPPKKEKSFFESQTFRIITIGIYLSGVGGLGFILAVYYFFIWDSRMPAMPDFKHPHHVG